MSLQDLIGKNPEWVSRNFKVAKIEDLKVGDIFVTNTPDNIKNLSNLWRGRGPFSKKVFSIKVLKREPQKFDIHYDGKGMILTYDIYDFHYDLDTNLLYGAKLYLNDEDYEQYQWRQPIPQIRRKNYKFSFHRDKPFRVYRKNPLFINWNDDDPLELK